jgi:DNA-binding transcriptional LysR family regulator
VRLTEAGNAFLLPANRVLDAAKAAEASITDISELENGSLSVGVFGQSFSYGLADIIADFHARFPGVSQSVSGLNSAEVADSVREGRHEAGIVFLPVDTTGLTVRPFFKDPILYVSADPTRTDAPMTIERFCSAPLVFYDAAWQLTDPTRRKLNEAAQRRGLTVRPVVDTDDVRVAIELTRRGVGDTIASRTMLDKLDAVGLHSVEFAEPITEALAIVHRVNSRPGPAARAFLEMFVRSLIGDSPGPTTAL